MRPIFKLIKFLLIFASGLAIFSFCLTNQHVVPINLWKISTFDVPLYLLMIIIFFSGILIISTYLFVDFISMTNKLRLLNKKLINSEKELGYLRTRPFEETSITNSTLPNK